MIFAQNMLCEIQCMCPLKIVFFSKPKRIYLGKPQYLVVIRVLFGQREANVELLHGFSSVTWYKNKILFSIIFF